MKFQMHIAEEEPTLDESFRVKIFPEDENRYKYWERTGFSYEMWEKIRDKCKEVGIGIIISPFSDKALQNCLRLGVKKLKIGSGEIFNSLLLERAADVAEELILSTGMSTWDDIDEAYKLCKKNKNLYLLQCTTKYPTELNEIGIENIEVR